jgi:hypothetical protein
MVFDIHFVSMGNAPYGVDVVGTDSTLITILKEMVNNEDAISIRIRENNQYGRIIFSTATYMGIDGALINENTHDEFNLLKKVA